MNAANWAPRLPPCENCGGSQVGNLEVVSSYHVGLHTVGRTMMWSPLSSLNAVVCLSCGLTKLFAGNLGKLREEAQKHPERFGW